VRTPAVLFALLLIPLLSAQEPARPPDTVVVIDPGHGGDDTGVRGAGGLTEKQLTLDIAQRLKSQLEGRLGVRVLLTRSDDVVLGPDARASLANNNRGSLFLSLHANAAFSPSLAGAEIYTPAADPLTGTEEGQAIELLPWNGVQARHATASARLAGLLHDELARAIPMSPRQVQAASMRPLVGVNMPAVVVEMLYLTNPEQEKMAADDAFKDGIAQRLADAIARFRTADDFPSAPTTPDDDPAGLDLRPRPAEAR
jgi:N-acetylmuramoyl-L-alanine amidase